MTGRGFGVARIAGIAAGCLFRILGLGLAFAAGGEPAGAAPIRTGTPGTGVVLGFGLSERFTAGRESGGGAALEEVLSATELRYTPDTHWALGVRVPLVRRTYEAPGLGSESASGLGDVLVSGKYRFFRQIGRWWDRQAAVELGIELPTGATDAPVGSRLPLEARHALQPGSGSVDALASLLYQQARGRFVQAAGLTYRRNGEDAGYRFGGETRLDLDAEAILLPLHYEVPGHEVFGVLEASFVRRGADELRGRRVAGTGRTEILLAPGLEYVATERLVGALSVQFPVYSEAEEEGRESDWNALFELRFSF